MKRLLFALGLAACCVAAVPQQAPKIWHDKDLPLAVRPKMPIPYFANKPLISVSEYAQKKGDRIIRVFRYSYKGELFDEISKLNKLMPKKDGWHHEDESPFGGERMVKHPLVLRQAFVIQARKAVRNEKVRAKTSVYAGPEAAGWIWISYNEELKTTAK